ncbi:MAG: ATP-dependent helicase, partial [Planctomycetaceae bacterium]|nr:ATP-dependent helicase [Planctomycetaceae bacterium]
MPRELQASSGGATNVEVNVAKTFLASAQNLATSERGRVFDFMVKFMNNPAHPSISLERVHNTADAEMWSARITQGLRAIIHRSGSQNTLLYAGQHDEAYHWAERRRVEHHPVTGSLQIVETTETADALLTSESPPTNQPEPNHPGIFADFEDDYLLSLGVPRDWLPTIRRVRFEDQVLTVVERLPEEVGERLLALASGEFVTPPTPVSPDRPLSENPDNLRRFWVVQDAEELRDVLSRPLAEWVKFLHPSQWQLATGEFRGAVKVTGAAGTGKTVVALHRASHLARQGHRVFMTSYVSTLCRNLRKNLQILCSNEALSRITVETIHHRALCFAQQLIPEIRPLESREFHEVLDRLRPSGDSSLSSEFLMSEWAGVVEPRGITSWDEYRQAPRPGRNRRLKLSEREACWQVFEALRSEMEQNALYPWEQICEIARTGLETGHIANPFDAVIVDEVQDLAPSALRFLAELAKPAMHNLFVVGDAGQRIYPGGFSLRQLGIDVRGRSHVLRINYRTTEQIRRFADRLLPEAVDDLDSSTYKRRSHCLLHGPAPQMQGFA